MKMIAKNVTRDVVNEFESQLSAVCRTSSSNTKTVTYHYYAGDDEVARVTYNYNSKLYNIRMAD